MPPPTAQEEFRQEQEGRRGCENGPQLEAADRGLGAGRGDCGHGAGDGLVEQAGGLGGEFGESGDVGGAGAQFVAGGEEDRTARTDARFGARCAGVDLDSVGLEARCELQAIFGRKPVETGAGALHRRFKLPVAAQHDQPWGEVAGETPAVLDHAEFRFEELVPAVEAQVPLGARAPVGRVAHDLGDETGQFGPSQPVAGPSGLEVRGEHPGLAHADVAAGQDRI